MEILRVPPYPIVTKWDVPEANAQYTIYVEDVVDHSSETTVVTSDSNSQVTYTLPRSKVQYDRDFVFRVYDTDIFGEIVIDSNLTVYRPYVDPNTLGTTASEINEYKRLEIIARAIIDAYLGNDSATGEGFYNHKLILQTTGQGTDYIPLWHNGKKILRVYENNVLVYNGEDISLRVSDIEDIGDYTHITTNVENNFLVDDIITLSGFEPTSFNVNCKVVEIVSTTEFKVKALGSSAITTNGTARRTWETTYMIAPDNSAIMRVQTGDYNRLEQVAAPIPMGYGDLAYYGRSGSAFPKGVDYIFILDVGYKAVPPDVEQATTMLIEDLKCGDNDYYKRFVTQYGTDQFNIKFAPQFLGGTGNLIVDRILDNYKGTVLKLGVI